jgi:hypothetical protein
MAIGKKQPASRSDIAKLRKEREEKKRKEKEAKRYQEEQAKKPKPNLGTEGKEKPEQDAPFMKGMRRKGPEDLRKDLKSSAKDAESRGDVGRTASEAVGAAKDFGSKLMTSIQEIGKAAVAPDEKVPVGSQGKPTNPFDEGYMSADDQDTMTGIGDIGQYYYNRYKDPVRRGLGQASDFIRGAQKKTRDSARSIADYMSDDSIKARQQEAAKNRANDREIERGADLKAELEAADDGDMKEAYGLYLNRLKQQYPNAEHMWAFADPNSEEYDEEEYNIGYQEFVQDMTGISPNEDPFALESHKRYGGGITGSEARARLEGKGEKQVKYVDEDPYDNVPPVKTEVMVAPRTNLNVKDFPSGSRDESNENRIRNITARRKAEGKTDLDDGMSRGANATGVDPVTGLPVVKGNIVRTDGVNVSRQRRAPNASTMQVLQDPNLSNVDKAMYFAQEMGLDFDRIPPEEHVDAAITFTQAYHPATLKKKGYVISGDGSNINMAADNFDPESLDVLRGTQIREDGDQGTTITGSAPRTYVPGKELLAKRENRKNYQNFLRDSKSHNASIAFQNNDGGVFTNKYRLEDGSFDAEQFDRENPGILLDPSDPRYNQRLNRVIDAIDRGTAVKQQNINRGYMQNLQSPTLNPIMMKQSLDQTDDLREKAEIALGHGNRELADMYLQMDADDNALLLAEAGKENEEVNFDAPGATTQYLKSQLASGDLTSKEVIGTVVQAGVPEDQATNMTITMLANAKPPAAVMADPVVISELDRLIGMPMQEFMDPVRGTMLAAEPEVVRDKFIRAAMTKYGFPPNYQPQLFNYWNRWQRQNGYQGEIPGEQRPQRTTEDQQPEGVQPPAGMN